MGAGARVNLRRGTDVRGTDVRGTDVRGTDVRGTDVRGTDVRGTDVWGTDERGTEERILAVSRHDHEHTTTHQRNHGAEPLVHTLGRTAAPAGEGFRRDSGNLVESTIITVVPRLQVGSVQCSERLEVGCTGRVAFRCALDRSQVAGWRARVLGMVAWWLEIKATNSRYGARLDQARSMLGRVLWVERRG